MKVPHLNATLDPSSYAQTERVDHSFLDGFKTKLLIFMALGSSPAMAQDSAAKLEETNWTAEMRVDAKNETLLTEADQAMFRALKTFSMEAGAILFKEMVKDGEVPPYYQADPVYTNLILPSKHYAELRGLSIEDPTADYQILIQTGLLLDYIGEMAIAKVILPEEVKGMVDSSVFAEHVDKLFKQIGRA